jgi:hypothetical protein
VSNKTNVVYLLWHVRERTEREDAEILIGVYSSEATAQAAIERLKDKPGFVENFQGFQICPYDLDLDHWTEGFKYMD